MIGALIRVRFRALFAGLTRQSRTGKKKTSPVLFIVLYGYIALMMVFLLLPSPNWRDLIIRRGWTGFILPWRD